MTEVPWLQEPAGMEETLREMDGRPAVPAQDKRTSSPVAAAAATVVVTGASMDMVGMPALASSTDYDDRAPATRGVIHTARLVMYRASYHTLCLQVTLSQSCHVAFSSTMLFLRCSEHSVYMM